MQGGARVRISIWEPTWEGSVEQWTRGYTRSHKWRCDIIHDVDDLTQDGYILFDKLKKRYPRIVDPAVFMGLYKTCFVNFINDKSCRMRNKKRLYVDQPQDVSELWTNNVGETTNSGYLSALLAEAPEELRLALMLVGENPNILPATGASSGKKLNMKLRRILGLADTFDFKTAIYDLLCN